MKFKTMLIITICVMLVAVTGCDKVPQLENGQELIVEMEGINITVDELFDQMKDRYAREVLVDMIDNAILNDKYETDDELDSFINGQVAYIKEQTGEHFLETIKAEWGLNSEQELYEFIELSLKRNLAVDDYIKTIITDREITEYYEVEIEGDIKARHILIRPKVTDDMTFDEMEDKENEALELAKELINRLNDGADFEELAKEYSDDEGSAINGGDLGWFNRGRMVKPFEDAAYALEIGEYSQTPVTSDFGFHIILKEDHQDKPELDEVKDDIIEALIAEKLHEDSSLSYVALEELRKEYNLVIHDTNINNQYNELMRQLKTQ